MLSLIGVLIIIVGFILKIDTIAVVLVAGITTGLVGGLDFVEILTIIGDSFIKTRYMSLFLLTLPVIGILERYGLREHASSLIKRMKSVSAGRVLTVYYGIRELAAALSLRLGGHVQFIRPLVNPMAHSAAEKLYGEVDEEIEEIIKGYSATVENLGNFFGQNVFVAAGGVLMIVATLGEQGIEVLPIDVAKASIPIAIFAFVYGFIQNYLLDKKIKNKCLKSKQEKECIK